MSNIYEAIFVTPWPFWVGGIAIGLLVPALYYYQNIALGVSTGYGNFLKLFLGKSRSYRWLNKDTFKDPVGWRLYFIVGMIMGAFVSGRLSGRPLTSSEMGVLTHSTQWSFLPYAFIMLSGGILLGLGARIAGGCTSGHSIHGLATLQKSALVVTIGFILLGVIATYLIRIFLLGGVTP
jgi:uncharacterized membrane protein YedE/YeeE